MDQNTGIIQEKRIIRTIEALCKNNYDAHYIKDKDELFKKLDELMPEGASCSVGGSMTLFETGVIDYIKSGKFTYYDRYAPNADIPKVFHDALCSDVYLMSSNAITENGELYNIDGTGNRVAALVYGPKKVVVIAGENKIVKDIDAAKKRKASIASPANAVRLNKDTPCGKIGYCTDCSHPSRFCCHELVSYYQQIKNRITVLILPESYGY